MVNARILLCNPEGDIVTQNMKSMSIVMLILLSSLSTIMIAGEDTQASTVVITEAIQVVDGGPSNDVNPAVAADSEGNIHLVWTRSNQHLYYTMLSPRGETMIDATQITSSGIHRIWHPDMVIDEDDHVHIVWADKAGQHKIMYTALDPSKAQQDGSASDDSTITLIADEIIAQHSNNRDWPTIDVDSQGNIHIAWEDNWDELDKFYQQPQIYYSMIQPVKGSGSLVTLFDDTLLTPVIGHKGHPDLVVDAEDMVQIAWDDTRGGKVELAFVVDTSGSMYSEWADVCTVIYGGSFASGGSFQGLKPMLEKANMTVYETIYGLGNTLPGAASSGNCASHNNANANPPIRSTPLGLTPGDDSGGLRKLPGTIYNGNTYSGYSGEDWGPGTNWACLSWKDANGNVPGQPPTQYDHRWNPNATKIVIPVSDEGPKDGDPKQQADDTQSIEEAHDSCVRAGVIPVGMYGQTYGGGTDLISHFKDLVQCPNGVVSTATRNCQGTTIRNTDAGGQAYEFPSGSSGSSGMQLLVEAMVYISTNNSREIYMSVLDPYAKMAHSSYQQGMSGHSTAGSAYVEDTGIGSEGHLVVVNDTRVTIDDAFSFHPSIGVDLEGNTHIAWMDGRDYGFEKEVNYEVYYTKLRLRGAGAWDGRDDGLSTYAIKKIDDTAISEVEGVGGLPQNVPWGGHSAYPSLLTDDQNNVHIAWHDFGNLSSGEEVLYTRLNETDLTGPGETALDSWEAVPITKWKSDKLGPNSMRTPDLGTPPAFSNDLGSGAHVAWSDSNKCSDEGNNNRYTICYTHVLTGQVDLEYESGETYYHEIEPGEQTIYNLTINNTTPGPKDLVADTYNVNISGVPTNWSATLFFASNHTAIFPDTPIYLLGGEAARFYLRVKAPSIYQTHKDELAQITVSAVSTKDPAIRSDLVTVTLCDVVHGINLEASHYVADIEQGQTAIFSITITNTGNVYDTFAFYDPNTLEGQSEWLLPFGWQVIFPLDVSLDPGQSVTKNLEVQVPTKQDPNTFVLYLKGWSTGEPVLDMNRGTYDVLELWVNVSIRSTGNIVFEIYDRTEDIKPNKCARYDITVYKNFDEGLLEFDVFGPEERNAGIDEEIWRETMWTVDLDFSNAPEPQDPSADPNDPDAPRLWDTDPDGYVVGVNVCAPKQAEAGLGPAVTIRANLQGYPRVSDSELLSTNVIHVFDLDTSVADEHLAFETNPGQDWTIPVTTKNEGNGPDRYDLRLNRVFDASGVSVLWDVNIPRDTLVELDSSYKEEGHTQIVDIVIEVPDRITAGEYVVELQAFSEEAYKDDGSNKKTRLRDTVQIKITVVEFHDMQISIDPTVDNAVKTSAPGKTVQFIVNITNNGNVADTPRLYNHSSSKDQSTNALLWSQIPNMGSLTEWSVSWAIQQNIGSDITKEVECEEILSTAEEMPEDSCVYLTDLDQYRLPRMDPYSTYTVVASIHIGPNAVLDTRYIGLKVVSESGGMEVDGDHDDSLSWEGDNLDTNELIVQIRLRAPNLVIKEVKAQEDSADVGETIPIKVVLANTGNVHASDVELVLCRYDEGEGSVKEIEKNGCEENSVVIRQTIGAIRAPDASSNEMVVELFLLYQVEAGTHDIYVVVDPNDDIVEVSERDNVKKVPGDGLSSSGGILDVATELAATYSLPAGVMLLTISLFGVLFLVGRGRRAEVKAKIAEQSSLITVLGNEEEIA